MNKNIILFGPPGAGKGRQSNILLKVFEMQLISPGNLFRSEVNQDSDLGFKIKNILSQGDLVPNQITNEIVASHINNLKNKTNFLFDGYPRNIIQAKYLTNLLDKIGSRIDFVFDLQINQKTLLERLKGRLVCKLCKSTYHKKFFPLTDDKICDFCGGEIDKRSDDNVTTIVNRMNVYSEQTKAALNYYAKDVGVIKINATLSAVTVFQSIYSYIISGGCH